MKTHKWPRGHTLASVLLQKEYLNCGKQDPALALGGASPIDRSANPRLWRKSVSDRESPLEVVPSGAKPETGLFCRQALPFSIFNLQEPHIPESDLFHDLFRFLGRVSWRLHARHRLALQPVLRGAYHPNARCDHRCST